MQVHTSAITLESFASLVENGVNHGVFIGDADTPVESTSTWETMIDELFGMYTIPGRDIDVVPSDSLDELVLHMTGLHQAADYFMSKLQAAKVFDRAAWLEANEGTFNQTNIQDFYKDITL